MKRIEKVVGIVLLLVSPALLWGATLSVPTGYPTIQSAVDAAADGDVVEIEPGVYEEVVDFLGRAITVTSLDPGNPEIVASTIVWVIRFRNNEKESSVLEGLTISNGAYPDGSGPGIRCYDSSPTIQNNLITGNGIAIDCEVHPDPTKRQGCSPLIRGNLITHNRVGIWSTGVSVKVYASPIIINNTFYGNTWRGVGASHWGKATIRNCILWDEEGCVEFDPSIINDISFSCIKGVRVDSDDVIFPWDPLFVDPANGDFHLKSQAGRWLSRANNGQGGWVIDEVQSPCIDAGSPEADFANEPSPNGGRINLGAYGNTPFASKSCRVPTQIKMVSVEVTVFESGWRREDFYFDWWARKDEVYYVRYSTDLVNWTGPWYNPAGGPYTVEKDGPKRHWGEDLLDYPYPKRRFYRLQIEPR